MTPLAAIIGSAGVVLIIIVIAAPGLDFPLRLGVAVMALVALLAAVASVLP